MSSGRVFWKSGPWSLRNTSAGRVRRPNHASCAGRNFWAMPVAGRREIIERGGRGAGVAGSSLGGPGRPAQHLAHQVGGGVLSGKELELQGRLPDEHLDAGDHGATAATGILDQERALGIV